MENILPVGKLPPDILKRIIEQAPVGDPRLIMGPGIGLDCGIIDNGNKYLVLKTDPITFATEEIGWYAIQIIANDIATTGATPLWLMVTALFPQGRTNESLIQSISGQLFDTCRTMNITLVNAHTEITYGIDRPILMCSLVGEIEKDKLITPWGAKPGDDILITKGIPIEGTALLAKEFSQQLIPLLNEDELKAAQEYTHNPGIGVSTDARIAVTNGKVTAMHDPTEGGLASALWELSEACGYRIEFDSRLVPISGLSQKICSFFGLNPLNTIASGALLMSVAPEDANKIIRALINEGIPCAKIGTISDKKQVQVWNQADQKPLFRPEQDEIAKIFSK
ncbi:MAG: AIR synthase family protein [Flexilinea sp.]